MGIGDVVGDFVDGAQEIVSDPGGAVAGVFDIGEASGDDHGSSNWAAWGHAEIRTMLDTTVEPADLDEAAQAWHALQENAKNIITDSVTALREIVSDGWRGESADAAIRSLKPVDDWADSVSAAMDHTAHLMDTSGYYAGQAKATVPSAQPHDWRRSLGSFALAGGAGAFVDAVAQDQAQEQARAEAVRIMTNVYSAPINENRAAVPTYPQLADPTLQPPEQAPISGPSPGSGQFGPRTMSGGSGTPIGRGVASGGVTAGNSAYLPPAVAGLQGGVPGSPDSPSPGGPSQPAELRRPVGGVSPATPGGAPIMTPPAGASTGGDAQRARRGGGGAGFGSGRVGGVGGRVGGGGGHAGGGVGGGIRFGPRGSGGVAAGAGEGGRFGAGLGGGTGGAAAGRGGAGGAPMAAMGAGRGQGGEDTEHRRPSYLIEMDDVFNDGRKVAPPVIGEDLPEYYS